MNTAGPKCCRSKGREAHTRRRPGAGASASGGAQSLRHALPARHALLYAPGRRAAQTEVFTGIGVDFSAWWRAWAEKTSLDSSRATQSFGGRQGALAEYLVIAGQRLVEASRPTSPSSRRAAPQTRSHRAAGACRNGHTRPGQTVLINGAVGRRRHLRGADRQSTRRGRHRRAAAATVRRAGHARSAPTTPSTTPREDFPRPAGATTSSSTSSATTRSRPTGACSSHRPLRDGRRTERPLAHAPRSRRGMTVFDRSCVRTSS